MAVQKIGGYEVEIPDVTGGGGAGSGEAMSKYLTDLADTGKYIPGEDITSYFKSAGLSYSKPGATGADQNGSGTVNDPLAVKEPTAGQAYGSVLAGETPEERAYRLEQERQMSEAQKLATGAIDEETIRANVEKQFQAEIDALNRVYAEKKKELGIQNQDRLGGTTSVQARRGLIGSDFGAAQTDTVKSYNQDIMNAAEAERAAKEANIRAAARGEAQKEIKDRITAKQQGAQAYLEFLKGASERKATSIKNVVANMLSDGLNPDNTDMEGLAKELGIDVATLKRQYNESKAAAEAEAEKAKQAGAFNLSEGQGRYDINGNLIAKNAGTEKPLVVSPGSSIYDSSGKLIGTAPNKIEPEKPFTVGKNLVMYDPLTGTAKVIYNGESDPGTNSSEVSDWAATIAGGKAKFSDVPDGLKSKVNSALNSLPPKKEDVSKVNSSISMIDKLINHPGLNSSVGPNGLSRIAVADAFGNKSDFIAGVQQLVSQQTLNNLINAKAQGATFGALSEGELKILQSAATKIEPWVVKDKNGNVTGFNVSEKAFKAELERIKSEYQNLLNENAPASSGENDPLGINGQQSFNSVGGDTNIATKAAVIPDQSKGGQCGRFVNKLTGLGVGDSYASKMAKMDPTIKYPAPGMVFVMPYGKTGHTGIIMLVKDGMATVKDSNYSLDEKVKTHQIPVSKMTGFTYA